MMMMTRMRKRGGREEEDAGKAVEEKVFVPRAKREMVDVEKNYFQISRKAHTQLVFFLSFTTFSFPHAALGSWARMRNFFPFYFVHFSLHETIFSRSPASRRNQEIPRDRKLYFKDLSSYFGFVASEKSGNCAEEDEGKFQFIFSLLWTSHVLPQAIQGSSLFYMCENYFMILSSFELSTNSLE